MNNQDTRSTIVPTENEISAEQILREIHAALSEKGYNPVMQIVGYLLTEDPTYITNYNNARAIISKIDRDDLLSALVEDFIDTSNKKG